jgi:hypothetical protein
MVYLDSEDLCYRENVVIAKAISKYGSESYHLSKDRKGYVHVSEKYKNNKTLVDVKNILASYESENEIIKE